MLKLLPLKPLSFMLPFLAAGCASVPLKSAGTLASYDRLGAQKGTFSKSRVYVDARALAPAKTVAIIPTTLAPNALLRVKNQKDRALVANALDREVCVALSDKFLIVPKGQVADLTVRAVVTDLVPTDKTIAGAATAVTFGSSVAGLPISIPRLPFGLGGLAVEAEALDRNGVQRAAILWARGANSISNKPRVSEVGDAYSLATTFGNEFSRILVTGKEPRTIDLTLPSRHRMRSWLGGKPKYGVCESFGRTPGLLGVLADKFGAPPEWTDKGAKASAP
ncbi:DUF3313 domain-containing protein [Mesorhizobium loti]|nr:DUF3313 domain-containing protein [Mesorhizobium loti]PLP56158.1 DUF3313 domain-containing protein [Mesorhizobium loti]